MKITSRAQTVSGPPFVVVDMDALERREVSVQQTSVASTFNFETWILKRCPR